VPVGTFPAGFIIVKREASVNDSTWERYGLAAGIAFVVLVVVAALIGGAPPKPTDSAAKILSYFRDNQDALKVGSYLNGLAAVTFIWFLGSLWARLRRAEVTSSRLSVIALVGGIASVAFAIVASGIVAYVALYVGELGGSGAQAFYLLATVFLAFSAFALAVFTSATSVMILRYPIVERFLGWVGEGIASLWLVAGIGVADNNAAIHTVGFIAFLVWAGWLLILTVLLLTRDAAAVETTAH
jgi:riboflavin transporter FmnP